MKSGSCSSLFQTFFFQFQYFYFKYQTLQPLTENITWLMLHVIYQDMFFSFINHLSMCMIRVVHLYIYIQHDEYVYDMGSTPIL